MPALALRWPDSAAIVVAYERDTVRAVSDAAPEMAWGDTFFIYDPERNFPDNHRFPFATIVINDYPG